MADGTTVLAVAERSRGERLAERLPEATVLTRLSTTAGLAALDGIGAQIDCVVIDHEPPDRDCFPLLGASTAVPVVVASTDGSGRLASEVLGAGAVDYVDLGAADAGTLAERVSAAVAPETARLAGREGYETIVETVPDGVFVLDEQARIVGGNERGAEMLGFEKAALLGTRIPELIDRGVFDRTIVEEYAALLPDLLSTETDREVGRIRFPVWPAEGDEQRLFEARIAVRPFEDAFRGTIGVLRDVTERTKRREELERYETIVDAVPDTVYAVDEDGYFTFVNEAAIEEFGNAADDVEVGSVHFSETVADEDVQKFQEATRRLLSDDHDTGRRMTVEYTAVTKDGRRYPAESHFAIMSSEDGVRGAGISRDVSERHRQQRRIEVLNRVLRHNLRNDLTAIVNLADAIEVDSDDPAVVEQRADRIRSISHDLAATSDRFRKLAAVIDRRATEDDWIDAVPIVERAVSAVADAYPAAGISTDLPDRQPVAATDVLESAIVELIENAVEHNDHEQPQVSVTLSESDRDGWVDVTVADDGPGIPEAELAALSSDQITPLDHSSGLGLWTVVWIVESYHGEVDVREREPRGTEVVLRLKRCQDRERPEGADTAVTEKP